MPEKHLFFGQIPTQNTHHTHYPNGYYHAFIYHQHHHISISFTIVEQISRPDAMNQIQFIPKANCPPGSKIIDQVDKEPWSDVMDRKEDREMYPDDWMKKIFLDQDHYDDLLSLLEPQLKIAVPSIHPNKLLRTTLRHLVEGDTCTDAQEPAVILVGQVIQFVLQADYQVRVRVYIPSLGWDTDSCIHSLIPRFPLRHNSSWILQPTLRISVASHIAWEPLPEDKSNRNTLTYFFPALMDSGARHTGSSSAWLTPD